MTRCRRRVSLLARPASRKRHAASEELPPTKVRILAYVYTGWHPIPERDRSFYPGFTEWDLVEQSQPRFAGHAQPRLPAWGRYDDRDPVAVDRRIAACSAHGIDGLVVGYFWCRGKQVFDRALDEGILGSERGRDFPFGHRRKERINFTL